MHEWITPPLFSAAPRPPAGRAAGRVAALARVVHGVYVRPLAVYGGRARDTRVWRGGVRIGAYTRSRVARNYPRRTLSRARNSISTIAPRVY
jgi:hypothetical protein